MHSIVIIVESMSATSSFLRRPDSPWTITSTPETNPSNAARTGSGAEEKSMSQALSTSTQERPIG